MTIKPRHFGLAVLAFGIPAIVLAQVATSSDMSIGTSTGDVVASTTQTTSDASSSGDLSTDMAFSTASDASTTETSSPSTTPAIESTSTLESISPATTSSPALSADAVASIKSQIGGIASLEDQYIQKNGKYLQVLRGDVLPPYESGSVTAQLGNDVPTSYEVDTYQSPLGVGYQITYAENGVTYSVGYGPEAASRTYTIEPSAPLTASSTPTQ